MLSRPWWGRNLWCPQRMSVLETKNYLDSVNNWVSTWLITCQLTKGTYPTNMLHVILGWVRRLNPTEPLTQRYLGSLFAGCWQRSFFLISFYAMKSSFILQMSLPLGWNMLTCYETLKDSQDMQVSLLREFGTIFTRRIVSSKLIYKMLLWPEHSHI